MNDLSLFNLTHTQRAAVVYSHQSTPSQIEHIRESIGRQYALVNRDVQLGRLEERFAIIDEGLGLSTASAKKPSAFVRTDSEVGLARLSLTLPLEVSRPARNNAGRYQLCGLTDTLMIGDNTGTYCLTIVLCSVSNHLTIMISSTHMSTCFGSALSPMLSCVACPAPPLLRHCPSLRRAMPQLNLNFANVPDPLVRVWERLDYQQKQIIIETLARLLTKGSQTVKPEEPSHD